jgi:hypothetical protein
MRELITVETRLDADGDLRPESFLWRGRRYAVLNHGRRWEQAGQLHFLVQDSRQGTYELAFEPEAGRWSVLRAPEDFGPKRSRKKA